MNNKQLIINYALQHKHENPYFINNEKNFIKLIELIVRCKSGFARSLATQNKDLLEWINNCLPKLQDECYQISTKCYWILNGLLDFPQCKHCKKSLIGKNVKLNFGYRTYCSTSCEVNDNKVLANNLRKRWKKFHQQNIAFTKHEFEKRDYRLLVFQMLSYMNYHNQIEWLIENRTDSCIKMISSKNFKYLKDFILNETKFLNNYHPSFGERIFCTSKHISSIDNTMLRCKTCNKILIGKPCSLKNGYQEYCSTKCIAQNQDLIKQKQKTSLKKYGTVAWNVREVNINVLTEEQKANRQLVWDKHAYYMEKTYGIKNYGCSHKHSCTSSIFSFNIYNSNAKHQLRQTSKTENRCFYMLLMLYPYLIRQFKSNKYPFKCDFYDPVSDTYIEFNGTWAHGYHFFNSKDENDVKTALQWKNSIHTTYQSAYRTWTYYDIKKRKCAEENNLKYIVFWTEKEVRKYVLDELNKIASKM